MAICYPTGPKRSKKTKPVHNVLFVQCVFLTTIFTWNAAISTSKSVTPEAPAVVVPTDVVLGALAIVVTVALFVSASVAARAEVPIQIGPTSRSCNKIAQPTMF